MGKHKVKSSMSGNRLLHAFKNSLCFLLLLSLSAPAFAQETAFPEGEKIFKAQCTACHHPKRVLVGPALGGAWDKYANDREFMYAWVKNAPGIAKDESGPYYEKAVALSGTMAGAMNAFTNLTNEQIDATLQYAKEQAAPPVEVAEKGPGPTELDPSIYYALLGLVGVLLLVALLLVVITATLITAVRAKEEKEAVTFADIFTRSKGILQNKFVMTAIAAFVLVGGGAKLITEARGVSLHQGYMPEQPIKFSHKLHAGQYEIDCQYCHTGASKSKSAWIPSSNVCMNCHKYIQEGPQYGTEEIAKIYEAIGYDPETGAYKKDYDQKPVEWVRIHNLPDHAYFNHAQHVSVGKIECQTCHGPIQEMEVVYQYNTLGMGWCIECHREEKVKTIGGVENDEGLTVEDMGGLNCARCHY
ncbi:MAG: c-type cytochrome [Bacteroidota bacterium]